MRNRGRRPIADHYPPLRLCASALKIIETHIMQKQCVDFFLTQIAQRREDAEEDGNI